MSIRTAGLALSVAALLFWCSWVLMPGVGVTDARQIFALVGAARPLVAASVVLQLLSSALYVPALLGVVVRFGDRRGVMAGAVLLLLGAQGSAADAVIHLLAYAMTAPGTATAEVTPVMVFMQGPALKLLAPLLLCFFIGGPWLAHALAQHGIVSRRVAPAHWLALLVAVAGGALASRGLVPGRWVGLTTLAIVSGAQAWLGLAVAAAGPHARVA